MRTVIKIFLLSLFFVQINLTAQVGINTTNPSAAAVLDISSSSDQVRFGGVLLPRVSLAERNSIAVGPADDGLLIFLSQGDTRCVQLYNAVTAAWEDVHCMSVNQAPLATAVNYNGSLYQGASLTASFVYIDNEADPEGVHTYNWYRATDASGSNLVLLQSGSSNNLLLTAAEIGYYIAVEVIPEALAGTSPGLPVRSVFRGPGVGPLSGGMLISEIADPVNDSSARFIELANSSNALLDLSGWELSIYANANTNPASTYTFADFSYLMAGQTFVIAQNASAFNTMYGFNPDASAALFNSNGDDNFELRDQDGVVVDRYGEPGVDQSGNCAEFTDGRALRTAGITIGNPAWNDLEWIIRANVTITGCSDHANAAQTAPADFSPGIHPN